MPLTADSEADEVDRWGLYEAAAETWGTEPQIDMVGEECSELSAEVSRFMRGRSDESDLADEIADVEIMVEQMRVNLDEDVIEKAKQSKLKRLRSRLQEAGADV